jgi:ribose transport system permease protein
MASVPERSERSLQWREAAARRVSAVSRLPSLIALIALVILAGLTSPTAGDGSLIFFQWGNITDILRQVALIGMIALGMTFVILTGGIDLSVGSTLALATVIVAAALTDGLPGVPESLQITVAIGLAAAACATVGLINGAVVAKLRLQPFIATLATMIGIRGLAKWYSSNENVDIGFGDDRAARFADSFDDKLLVIGIYAATAALLWVVLARTVFGRHMRAIGDNPTASVYTGLPIVRTQLWVYTISGLLAGLAGVLYAAQNHQGNPNAGVAYELDAIAAVVIGGTRLAGGQGTIVGTVIGTLIMGVLTNMLRLNNVDSNLEMMIKAVLIVLAAALQLRKAR